MFFRIIAVFLIAINMAYCASKSRQKYELKKEIRELSGNLEFEDSEEYKDIDSRIHELSKEIYFLRGQIEEVEKNKKAWLINPKRSGIVLSLGYMLDFVSPNSFEVRVSRIDTSIFYRLGYLKYFNNNSGIRFELFNIESISTLSMERRRFFGTRFSFMRDFEVFSSNFVGLFLGFGFGVFNADPRIGGVLHIGMAYTINNKYRIEFERIFIPSHQNSYVLSYSFVF